MLQLLLGHLVGDYLLQTSWMAVNKSKKTLQGWMAAIVHTVIYTLSICTLMWNFNPLWILIVFLSHVFIDHYSTATWYLKHIKGMEKPRDTVTVLGYYTKYELPANTPTYTSLYWIIYVVVDNTMHLLLMVGAYKLFF